MNEPLVIDNACAGIGDAVVYAWMLHSANAESERLRIIPRGQRWVFELFNCGQWCEPDTDFGVRIGDHPPKGEVGGRSWLRLWLDECGLKAIPYVRPTHNLTEDELDAARARWKAGTGNRVLLFPDGPWRLRVWDDNKYVRLAWMLQEDGHSVLALLPSYREHMYPFAIGGMGWREMAAMIATADLVVGNESGPVHIAATMGVRSACLYGPTRPEMMHEQYGNLVVPIRTTHDRVPCLGCNFEFERGSRAWCSPGCFALSDVTPFDAYRVVRRALATGRDLSTQIAVVSGATRGYLGADGEAMRDAVRRYADQHGCDYLWHGDESFSTERPSAWYKVKIIQNALKLGYGRVLWVDADATVYNGATSPEQLFAVSDAPFLLAMDNNGLNTGIWGVRNTPAAVEALGTVWNSTQFINHPFWEQAAVQHLDAITPGLVGRIPKTTWNAYPPEVQAGTVFVHFPGSQRDFMKDFVKHMPVAVPAGFSAPVQVRVVPPQPQMVKARALTGFAMKMMDIAKTMRSPHRPMPRDRFREQDVEIINDVFDLDCYRVKEIARAARVIDVGACVGAFSCKVKERHPDATCLMVECEPTNARYLRETVAQRPGMVLEEAACWYGPDPELWSRVCENTDNVGGSTVARLITEREKHLYHSEGHVKAMTLEALMDRMGWDAVDVVKLDCEGSEMNILEHCTLSRVGVFVGEWHERNSFMELVRRRFGGWGFEILKEAPMGIFRLTNPMRAI